MPGVDEERLVAWSRLGDRLRLTSTAEFAGYDWGWTPRDFDNILRLARDLFPDAADYDRGSTAPASAHDAPGAADPGSPATETVPQLRPRPHRLDDGVRHRAHRRRSHDRTHARAGSGRPHLSPLSAIASGGEGARMGYTVDLVSG